MATIGLAALKRLGGFGEQARRTALKRIQYPVEVLADRAPGRIGFNEHAETGKPESPSDRERSRGRPASLVSRLRGTRGDFDSQIADQQRTRQLYNGPTHVDFLSDMGLVAHLRRNAAGSKRTGGHKLSAFRSPFRNICRTRRLFRFSTPIGGRQPQAIDPARHASVIASSHPLPIRSLASPPSLAAGPSRRSPLGGKARWQKRFVFPARRMRRGLQF
jgi:hypothetical protein